MTQEASSVDAIVLICYAILLAALSLSFVRLARGPSVNDRIAALDLIASIIMGFVLLYSVAVRHAIYFDIAIVISLISFIGTVAVSTYLRQRK